MKNRQIFTTIILLSFAVFAASWSSAVAAQEKKHQMTMKAAAATDANQTPYAGQQNRAIKTLSAHDVDDLESGKGWGFAKAAELNGVPGPSHLLNMKDKIGLTAEQAAAVSMIFAEMKSKAIPLGKRFVALEAQLNTAFVAGDMDDQGLKTLLDEIGGLRAELRFVHLSTHLTTSAILSEAQIEAYNRLRGY